MRKEGNPAFKMGLFEREHRVFHPGLTFVNRLSEQHRRPERIHGREVMFPIDFGDVVENGAEHFVLVDTVVESVDEKLDILLCSDVLQCVASYF